MGSDLYIEPFFKENKNKCQPLFDKAVRKRNAYKSPQVVADLLVFEEWGNGELSPGQIAIKTKVYPKEYAKAKALQDAVTDIYEKMYEVGYFRDSYNCSSLFNKLGLSWWAMADGKKVSFIDADGSISVANSQRLLALVKSLPLQIEEEDINGWVAGTTMDTLREYFTEKKKKFEEFLQFAIDNHAIIRASV